MGHPHEKIDASALVAELEQLRKRLKELEVEQSAGKARCKEIFFLLNQYLRDFIPEADDRFREAEARMLKSASRIITEQHKAGKAPEHAREEAMYGAKNVAVKCGFTDVTPRLKAEIDAKVHAVYSARSRKPSQK